MKHTLIIATATLALSACTCTCPENQYDFQKVQPDYQYTYQQPQVYNDQGSIQYYRYTQVSYTPPQPKPVEPEVIYYPVYQQPQVIIKQEPKDDCYCEQEAYPCPCGC